MGHFVKTWQKLGIRPPSDSEHPERTDEKYCYYDSLHRDYGYTSAYAAKLIRHLGTVEGWEAFFGEDPTDKDSGQRVAGTQSKPPVEKRISA